MRKDKAAEQSRRQVDEARLEADRQAWEARCKNCYGCGESVEWVEGKLTQVPCPDCTVPYVLSRFPRCEGFPKVTVVR